MGFVRVVIQKLHSSVSCKKSVDWMKMKTVANADVNPTNIITSTSENNIHIGADTSNNIPSSKHIESKYFDETSDSSAGTGVQFQSPTGSSTKRPISLDLNINKNPAKKQRLATSNTVSSSIALESPDINGIKMTTPDLEKFLLSGNLIQTPTPGLVFPTKVSIKYLY